MKSQTLITKSKFLKNVNLNDRLKMKKTLLAFSETNKTRRVFVLNFFKKYYLD